MSLFVCMGIVARERENRCRTCYRVDFRLLCWIFCVKNLSYLFLDVCVCVLIYIHLSLHPASGPLGFCLHLDLALLTRTAILRPLLPSLTSPAPCSTILGAAAAQGVLDPAAPARNSILLTTTAGAFTRAHLPPPNVSPALTGAQAGTMGLGAAAARAKRNLTKNNNHSNQKRRVY